MLCRPFRAGRFAHVDPGRKPGVSPGLISDAASRLYRVHFAIRSHVLTPGAIVFAPLRGSFGFL